jgi:hypothetical protein
LAYGANVKLVGEDVMEQEHAAGKPMIAEMVQVASAIADELSKGVLIQRAVDAGSVATGRLL